MPFAAACMESVMKYMKQSKKTVCLVLEGIGIDLLKKYMEQGYLQNLKGLLDKQGGNLRSTKVPYEGSALHTAFTGYAPEDSGVYSYWNIHNYEYIPQILDSSELNKQEIWKRKELEDKKFAVINIFGTHKPYPVNGYLLSYLFRPTLRGCYPINLIKELSKKNLYYTNDVSAFYTGGPREDFMNMVFKVEKSRIEVAFELLKDVDILISNFTIVDRLSHFYTQELDSEVFANETQTAIFKAYQLMDDTVGRFAETLDASCQMLIFSDLGFGPLREFVSFNTYLEQQGFLKRDADGKMNWKETVAFESVQGSHGVNINLEGLYRDGCVKKEEFEETRRKVMEYLKNLINPKTGLPFFKAVVKGEEYYPGPYAEKAPHIMMEPYDLRYLPLGDNYWAEHVIRTNQSGWHRRDGFWTGKGSKIDGLKKDGTILDICPTLYQLLGREVPGDLKGTSFISQLTGRR